MGVKIILFVDIGMKLYFRNINHLMLAVHIGTVEFQQ